jgi:hypothetical protein
MIIDSIIVELKLWGDIRNEARDVVNFRALFPRKQLELESGSERLKCLGNLEPTSELDLVQ